MNIKRFVANNVQEAKQMVKREMGADAVIMDTRVLPAAGKDKEHAPQRVEITAAIDYDAQPSGLYRHGRGNGSSLPLEQWRRMENELKEIKEALLSRDTHALMNPDVYYSKELRARYVYFKAFGLRPEMIRDFMHECQKGNGSGQLSPENLLQDCLSRVLQRVTFLNWGKASGQRRMISSFLGPTGVGKTTTLAKMAASRAVQEGRKVALISLDTFRIAAVTQLQSYARIMGVALEVAASRSDLQRAILKHRDCDLILIDTAGLNPNKGQDFGELKRLFGVQEKIHHHLVLSATTDYHNLLHAADQFGVLPYANYIFTKLDETRDVAAMLNFLVLRNRPVSHFTFGQQVPEDIKPASKKELASLVVSTVQRRVEFSPHEAKRDGSNRRHQIRH
jgi:flagellar biosynthesis protein FlhF